MANAWQFHRRDRPTEKNALVAFFSCQRDAGVINGRSFAYRGIEIAPLASPALPLVPVPSAIYRTGIWRWSAHRPSASHLPRPCALQWQAFGLEIVAVRGNGKRSNRLIFEHHQITRGGVLGLARHEGTPRGNPAWLARACAAFQTPSGNCPMAAWSFCLSR